MFKKPFIFVTGAPRSGTSMITKIIDSHPDVIILMENIFGNRKRYWQRAEFWNDDSLLKEQIINTYINYSEPVLGNKVITPDVWSVEDIFRFCNFFNSFKIVFVVRDPVALIKSRINREPENFSIVFNDLARQNLLLNFTSRIHVYLSSWRQSIENYWKLNDSVPERVHLIYYDDFCSDFENQLVLLFRFLGLPLTTDIYNWDKIPHHNAQGKYRSNLKYPDSEVLLLNKTKLSELPPNLIELIDNIGKYYNYWERRKL